MYIYLPEKDDFAKIPEAILKTLGETEFTMELELSADKKLARENASQVMESIADHGFHIQLPSETSIEELMAKISRSK